MTKQKTTKGIFQQLFSGNPFRYIGILAIVLLAYSSVLLPREIFLDLSSEDDFFETLSALLFLSTGILLLVLFFRKSAFSRQADQQFYNTFGKRIWFLLLGLLFLFMTGEEISWGQRIFNFDTPESLKEQNLQKEFNFHNLEMFHHYDKDNNKKTGWKAMFTAKRIFIVTFVSFLLLLPFLYKMSSFIQHLIDRLFIPVPAIELGILFIINSLIFRFFKMAYEYSKMGRSISEVEEFNMAVILFFIPFVWMNLPFGKKPVDQTVLSHH